MTAQTTVSPKTPAPGTASEIWAVKVLGQHPRDGDLRYLCHATDGAHLRLMAGRLTAPSRISGGYDQYRIDPTPAEAKGLALGEHDALTNARWIELLAGRDSGAAAR